MTITIGRFGRDITTPDVSSVQMSGSTVRVSGFFKAASLNAAKVLRQQLSGCVDNRDEPVVPVACTSDTSLNGFYRVTDASVDVETGDMGNFRFPWSATLERAVPGYNAPVERTLIAGLRTNGHSIVFTDTIAWFATQTEATASGIWPTFTSISGRTAADGGLVAWYDTNPGANRYVNLTGCPPSGSGGYYEASSAIESKWADGTNYYPLVGRNIPARVAASTATGHDWRITNGLIRITPYETTGASTDGWDLVVEHYDGSQWDTGKRYKFAFGGSSFTNKPWTQFTVLRNDAAAVSIRLATSTSGSLGYTLDLSLRRGARYVEGRTYSDGTGTVLVGVNTVEAATALTGGIRATSDDAAGNRYILASAEAVTNDLTNGTITSGSVTAFNFMIGSEVTGSSATGIETAQNTIYQYMCAQSETYRIVGR